MCIILNACSSSAPRIVYITATPVVSAPQATAPRTDSVAAGDPTPDPPRFDVYPDNPQEHIVRPGDTLSSIALAYGVSLNAILAVNDLPDPNTLSVGQVIQLPDLPGQHTPELKLIPDSRLVRGPGSRSFDVQTFVNQMPGYIRTAFDEVPTNLAEGGERRDILTAAQVVDRIAREYSVDARLLLALLEYRAGWLSRLDLPENHLTHPLLAAESSPGIDRAGLYRQLAWAANQLNLGYYGWKTRGWTTLEFASGARFLYAPGLNAGTVAIQYFLSLNAAYENWLFDVSANGLLATYVRYFGDPFAGAVDPVVPPGLTQPQLSLPFAPGETWFFTGGAHGGWGSGSAWAAVDFAPPDVPPQGVFCYTSQYWVRAVAAGVIARSDPGSVVLDLDGDGDESTGWTILYLHLAAADRIQAGIQVQQGDAVGRASCEGGFSTGTHLHIARRYNGEWIPAWCEACPSQHQRPPFIMGDWTVIGIRNQEYQGYLDSGGQRVTAEQGRLSPVNRISW